MTEDEEQRRKQLYDLLGDLPPRNLEISANLISIDTHENFYIENIQLELNGIESVPAYFIKPKNLSRPAPAILYNHYHAGKYKLGKDELLTPKPEEGLASYADDLSKHGYCVLCIDMWAFGERALRSENSLFKEFLWKGKVLWGMMLYDSLRAVDYLITRPEIDSQRIATLGMSMGSTMAWWLTALDTRIKVCVDLCCLTDFQSLIDDDGLDRHGVYYFVPSLLKYFTTSQINALIAPRAHLSLAGNFDNLTPTGGLDRIDRELREIYAAKGKPSHWKLSRFDVGHVETHHMRNEVLSFLDLHL